MVVFHIRVKPWLAAALVALAGVAAATFCAFWATSGMENSEAPALAADSFLAGLGCTDFEPVAEENVKIPAEFDEVYTRYNDIQAQSGFDLRPYRGKTVSRRTYALRGADTDYAVLLVANGKVIGGHLTNGEYGGEDQPLLKYGETG